MTQRPGLLDPYGGRVPRWLAVTLGIALIAVGGVLALRPFRSLAVLVQPPRRPGRPSGRRRRPR